MSNLPAANNRCGGAGSVEGANPSLLVVVPFGLVRSEDWDPFTIDKKCPKVVLAQTGQGGLGDQLEHYVFSLHIATLLHATIAIMDLRKG